MSPAATISSPTPTSLPLLTAPADNAPADVPAKISAYYSLVFPNITFFLQTLTVTIGRRCLPPASASVNGAEVPSPVQNPVDVDLGPLKSVSRLHAKIEYEEEEARFVLVVIGRNGAWVDGAWSGAGSRVPLGERSQIQIASRTFHFVLPPPAAVEDSPSPSSASSIQRARSPSVDITSISPPSSLPSHSPSPRTAPSLPPPKSSHSSNPQLPNSNSIPRTKGPCTSTSALSSSTAPTSKKRKKASHALPRPDVMPPKPSFTYAQLCYRAIKAMGGKATLQDICGWMMDNYDWYRYNEGAGWENSVRHNLSSGRAFKKMERSTGEHGKGFFWSVDTQYEHTFEEQEARAAAQDHSQSASSSAPPAKGKDGVTKKSKKKDKTIPLDPPLKRSVKSGAGPLPPPLTSAPLALPRRSVSDCIAQSLPPGQLVTGSAHSQTQGGPSTAENVDTKVVRERELDMPHIGSTTLVGGLFASLGSTSSPSNSALASGARTPAILTSNAGGPSSSVLTSDVPPSSVSSSPLTALPPSVCLPIIIGPVPSSHPSSCIPDPPPIVLHNNALILSPAIFGSLLPEQVKALEEMGAQKALEVLQGHIVRYLKERMGKKKRKKATASGLSEKGGTKTSRSEASEQSSPFATTPLPLKAAQAACASHVRVLPFDEPTTPHPHCKTPTTVISPSNLSNFRTSVAGCPAVESKEHVSTSAESFSSDVVTIPVESSLHTPVILTDDEDGRITKRRKLVDEAEVGTKNLEASVAPISRAVDEDIEVDVC